MSLEKGTLYLKGDQTVELKKRDVTIGDVMKMECTSPHVVAKVKTFKLHQFPEKGKHRCVISVLNIIQKIHEEYPNLEIQNLGSPDVIVTFEMEKTNHPIWFVWKTILVVAITSLGAAFSIMAFNNDVDTVKLFSQIYEQVMGFPRQGASVLEFCYCMGVAFGILVFFNHFGRKRFSVDPTPLEVEMRLYENDIQTTIIEDFSRKGQEIDVDQGNHSGNHRN